MEILVAFGIWLLPAAFLVKTGDTLIWDGRCNPSKLDMFPREPLLGGMTEDIGLVIYGLGWTWLLGPLVIGVMGWWG